VVFTDIGMPGALDGFGLAKWTHEHGPGVEVILTGTLPRTVRQAEELSEEGLLPKPYDAQAVHNQIQRLLVARKASMLLIERETGARLHQSARRQVGYSYLNSFRVIACSVARSRTPR
jgi:DNA-binding LytR/AlgR family response regulator